MTQGRHTNSGTCGAKGRKRPVQGRTNGPTAKKNGRGQKENTEAVFACVYLVSSGGEAQAQLPADHHGFVDAPVLAAHGAPASGSAHIHQHLHATLAGLASSRQSHLNIRQTGVFLTRWPQQIQLSLKLNQKNHYEFQPLNCPL